MNTLLKIAGCVALLTASWCAGEWALTWRSIRHVADELPALVADEAELTRQAAVEEIRAGRADATEAVDRLSARAAHQIDKVRAGAIKEVRRLRADLVTQSTLWRGEVSRQGNAANGTLAGLRSDARPVLDNAALLELESARTVRLLTPQLLGAIAALKVTSGNTAQITRDLKPAAPAAAKAVQNVERMTRPLGWPAKLARGALNVAKRLWIF